MDNSELVGGGEREGGREREVSMMAGMRTHEFAKVANDRVRVVYRHTDRQLCGNQ